MAHCPMSTLTDYVKRTPPYANGERKLFISSIKPHKAVTSSSIARGLQLFLEKAGINSSLFAAHSTREALASAAFRAGITTSYILKAANWSWESVFETLYHKEINRAAYCRANITQNGSKLATNNTVGMWNWAFWNIIVRLAKVVKQLQAIPDYMKKVKLNTSTFHTHLRNVEEELVKGERKWKT